MMRALSLIFLLSACATPVVCPAPVVRTIVRQAPRPVSVPVQPPATSEVFAPDHDANTVTDRLTRIEGKLETVITRSGAKR